MKDLTNNHEKTCDGTATDGSAVVAASVAAEGCSTTPAAVTGGNPHGKPVLAARVRDRQAEAAMAKLRYSLGLPSVGKSAEIIRKRVSGFRRALEAAVIAAHGEISLTDACSINTACAGERHSSLAAAEIRKNGDAMKPAEKLAYMAAMLSGAQTRDRAVEKLRLAPADGNDLASLYADLAREAAEKSATASQGAKVAPDSLEHAERPGAFPNASGSGASE